MQWEFETFPNLPRKIMFGKVSSETSCSKTRVRARRRKKFHCFPDRKKARKKERNIILKRNYATNGMKKFSFSFFSHAHKTIKFNSKRRELQNVHNIHECASFLKLDDEKCWKLLQKLFFFALSFFCNLTKKKKMKLIKIFSMNLQWMRKSFFFGYANLEKYLHHHHKRENSSHCVMRS